MAQSRSKIRRGAERRTVSVYLIREGVEDVAEALTKEAQKFDRTPDGPNRVVWKKEKTKEPPWLKFLEKLRKPPHRVRQQSPGAVLFVREQERWFAIPFGYGTALLEPSAIEHDFGLRVILNVADTRTLRSVDVRTLESVPQSTRKQFPTGQHLASFAISRNYDLLRGVAARALSTANIALQNQLLYGADALHCRVPMTVEGVHQMAAVLLNAYASEDYKKEFDWIDKFKAVRDDAMEAQLDGQIVDELKSETHQMFACGVPEILHGDELIRLKYSWLDGDPGDLDQDAAKQRVIERGTVGNGPLRHQLRLDSVELLDVDGKKVRSWNLLRCLLCETTIDEKRYVLAASVWYEVEPDFVAQVEADFKALHARTREANLVVLPSALAGEEEGDYNARARNSNSKLTLLDRTDVMGRLATGVEPCDLIDVAQGLFIHAKRGRKASQLSHMFQQGVNGLFVLLEDARVRANLRDLLTAQKAAMPKALDPVDATKTTVLYVVLDESKKTDDEWTLPFFSMLSARLARDRIQSTGARASILRVPQAPSPKSKAVSKRRVRAPKKKSKRA